MKCHRPLRQKRIVATRELHSMSAGNRRGTCRTKHLLFSLRKSNDRSGNPEKHLA